MGEQNDHFSATRTNDAPGGVSTGASSPLITRQFPDLEPLDLWQPGAAMSPALPPNLKDLLFDTHDETVQSYALIDAAKSTDMIELLEASDLDCLCLFTGEAFKELKDVAPWLVRLTKDSRFTRQLLSTGPASWHLWDKECGIFFKSRAQIKLLQSHFRKFTKTTDETGKSYFVRFWEPRWTVALLNEMSPKDREKFLAPLVSIFCIHANTGTEILEADSRTDSL